MAKVWSANQIGVGIANDSPLVRQEEKADSPQGRLFAGTG
jgi:hypothetical protein